MASRACGRACVLAGLVCGAVEQAFGGVGHVN